MVVVGALGVMLYGERLPEVARAWGKQLIQLKKNINAVHEQVKSTITNAAATTTEPLTDRSSWENSEDRQEAIAPKFEPPPPEFPAAPPATKDL